MRQEQLLHVIVDAIDAGNRVAVATVVACSGSTPRHLGAKMAVIRSAAGDNAQLGTIGGGRVEQEVVAALAEVAATGRSTAVTHHLVRDLAMCCGGSMTFALTFGNSMTDALRALVLDLQAGRSGTLSTKLDGSGWGWSMSIAANLPSAMHVDNGELFEILGALPRAIIFGLGHVARAMGPLLHDVGFDIVVCDDGETISDLAKPPWARVLVASFDVADVEKQVGQLNAGDYVLVVTRDHAVDQRIIETLVHRDGLGMVGLIGSRGKVARFANRLTAKGLITDHQDVRWTRIVAPVGLDIGAETPAEIAIAIVAQLVSHRRTGKLLAGQWQRV